MGVFFFIFNLIFEGKCHVKQGVSSKDMSKSGGQRVIFKQLKNILAYLASFLNHKVKSIRLDSEAALH